MLGLPGLLSSAISSACESGRPLSWNIQEGKRGTLIQLIWEPQPAQPERTTEAKVKVGSKQNPVSVSTKAVTCTSGVRSKRRLPPSIARRNARRLQEFLKAKQKVLASPASTSSLPPLITLPDGPEFSKDEQETNSSQHLALNTLDSSVVVDINLRELIFSD